MTYEERKKWICEQCNQKTDCAYVNRNMEYKCLLVEERMDGWELGWQDAIDNACVWLADNLLHYWGQINANDTDEFIDNFKKAMEQQ